MGSRGAWLGGVALIALTVGVIGVLVRDADILALRLPTPVLTPSNSPVTNPREAVEHFQCNRCHVIAGLEPASAPLAQNCVTCHQAIAAGRMDLWYREEEVTKWKANLVHLVRTPELSSLKSRVKRKWLVDWLQRPHVVRPRYGATMPRLPIDATQAGLLADFFGVTDSEEASAPSGDAAAGRLLFDRHACSSCHDRGEATVRMVWYGSPEFRVPSSRRRAPDLRYVAERMTREQVKAWLQNPRAFVPDTEMPVFSLTATELEDLTAFLFSPLPPLESAPSPRRPRLLERKVTYAEVAKKLSRHLCFHCHSNQRRPGDQGPGNSGGFGYTGASLDLATREGILRGVKRDGVFRGQPDRLEDRTPRLVASLLARQAELEGHTDPRVLGMPLGFPPIPDEDVDLINTWLEQGGPE